MAVERVRRRLLQAPSAKSAVQPHCQPLSLVLNRISRASLSGSRRRFTGIISAIAGRREGLRPRPPPSIDSTRQVALRHGKQTATDNADDVRHQKLRHHQESPPLAGRSGRGLSFSRLPRRRPDRTSSCAVSSRNWVGSRCSIPAAPPGASWMKRSATPAITPTPPSR